MDKRKLQKNHIKAAREWLSAAENSLDVGNDVISDLKLMLAKAELSNIKLTPKSQRIRNLLKKIMPAAAAILLGAGFYLWQGEEKAVKNPPAAATLPPPSKIEKALPIAPPMAEKREDTAIKEEKETVAAEVEKNKITNKAVATVNEVKEPVPAKINDSPKEEKNMPSPEMQQLMQSAGKVLRK